MNVTFRVGKKEGDAELEKVFLDRASKRGMISLKGHRLDSPLLSPVSCLSNTGS